MHKLAMEADAARQRLLDEFRKREAATLEAHAKELDAVRASETRYWLVGGGGK